MAAGVEAPTQDDPLPRIVHLLPEGPLDRLAFPRLARRQAEHDLFARAVRLIRCGTIVHFQRQITSRLLRGHLGAEVDLDHVDPRHSHAAD